MNRLASETATASLALENELPAWRYAKATHAHVLVDLAKRLQRLQTKAKRQRRDLAATLAAIKRAKIEVRAITKAMQKGDA